MKMHYVWQLFERLPIATSSPSTHLNVFGGESTVSQFVLSAHYVPAHKDDRFVLLIGVLDYFHTECESPAVEK